MGVCGVFGEPQQNPAILLRNLGLQAQLREDGRVNRKGGRREKRLGIKSQGRPVGHMVGVRGRTTRPSQATQRLPWPSSQVPASKTSQDTDT